MNLNSPKARPDRLANDAVAACDTAATVSYCEQMMAAEEAFGPEDIQLPYICAGSRHPGGGEPGRCRRRRAASVEMAPGEGGRSGSHHVHDPRS